MLNPKTLQAHLPKVGNAAPSPIEKTSLLPTTCGILYSPPPAPSSSTLPTKPIFAQSPLVFLGTESHLDSENPKNLPTPMRGSSSSSNCTRTTFTIFKPPSNFNSIKNHLDNNENNNNIDNNDNNDNNANKNIHNNNNNNVCKNQNTLDEAIPPLSMPLCKTPYQGIPVPPDRLKGQSTEGPYIWLANRSSAEIAANMKCQDCLFRRAAALNPPPTFFVAADRLCKQDGKPPSMIKMYGAFPNVRAFLSDCLYRSQWRCFYELIKEGTECKGHFDLEAKGPSREQGEGLLARFLAALQQELRKLWPEALEEQPNCFQTLVLSGSRQSKSTWKTSYHVILPYLIFQTNYGILKTLANSLSCHPELQYEGQGKSGQEMFSFVDKGIYSKNRVFRLPLCWKLDDESKTPFLLPNNFNTVSGYRLAALTDILPDGWRVPENTHPQNSIPRPGSGKSWKRVRETLLALAPLLSADLYSCYRQNTVQWPNLFEFLPRSPPLLLLGETLGITFWMQDILRFAHPGELGDIDYRGYLSDSSIDWALAQISTQKSGNLLPPWSVSETMMICGSYTLAEVKNRSKTATEIADRIRKQCQKLGRELPHQILVPANLENSHWYFLSLSIPSKTWSIVDSSPNFMRSAVGRVENAKICADILDCLQLNQTQPYETPFPHPVANNESGYDCAIHTILGIANLVHQETREIPQAKVRDARKWLVWSILWGLNKTASLDTLVENDSNNTFSPRTTGPSAKDKDMRSVFEAARKPADQNDPTDLTGTQPVYLEHDLPAKERQVPLCSSPQPGGSSLLNNSSFCIEKIVDMSGLNTFSVLLTNGSLCNMQANALYSYLIDRARSCQPSVPRSLTGAPEAKWNMGKQRGNIEIGPFQTDIRTFLQKPANNALADKAVGGTNGACSPSASNITLDIAKIICKTNEAVFSVLLTNGLLCNIKEDVLISFLKMKALSSTGGGSVVNTHWAPSVVRQQDGSYNIQLLEGIVLTATAESSKTFRLAQNDLEKHTPSVANASKPRRSNKRTKPRGHSHSLLHWFSPVSMSATPNRRDDTEDSIRSCHSADAGSIGGRPTEYIQRVQSSDTSDQRICFPPLFPNSDHIPLISLNVGRAGIWKSFEQLIPLFTSRPGVVMLQETWLSTSSALAFARRARQLIPGYSVFVKSTMPAQKKKDYTQVVTIVHGALAARATQLDLQKLASVDTVLSIEELSTRIHCIKTTDLHTEAKILFVNVYQYQSSERPKQEALLSLLTQVLRKESHYVDEVIIGGDWNASPFPRMGYSEQSASTTTSADSRLMEWIQLHQLNLCDNPTWTWEGQDSDLNHNKRAVLDFFLSMKGPYSCSTHLSPDPAHDHRAVCIGIPLSLLSPLSNAQPAHRPSRLKISQWKACVPGGKECRLEWQEEVTKQLACLEAEDKLSKLNAALCITLEVAKDILGVSKPRQTSHIPFHSTESKRIFSLRREIRAAVVDIRTRTRPETFIINKMSKAMRKVWDRGIVPENVDFQMAQNVRDHREKAQSWVDMLLTKKKELDANFRELRNFELSQARQKAINHAIEQMNTPGSREIKKLMGKLADNVSAPFLVSQAPDCISIPRETLQRNPFLDLLVTSLATKYVKTEDRGRTVYASIPPDRIFYVVEALAREEAMFTLSHTLGTEGRIRGTTCCTQSERLASIEYHLARDAVSTKARCPTCLAKGCLTPLSVLTRNKRDVVYWCTTCNKKVEPLILNEDYQEIPFPTGRVPKVPNVTQCRLRGKISAEDLKWYLQHLGCRKAPGSDEIPNEFFRDAPPTLFELILDVINSILADDEEERMPIPKDWKDGLIRRLFKGGCPTLNENWRSVVLLRTCYQVLSAIITDRVAKIAEEHKLIHPSQEGFTRDHNCGRLIQSMLWGYEKAKEKLETLIVLFLDFKNAFNSMDHQALFRWLEEINMPDLDLLRDIYLGSFYEADTENGLSAKIFLTRGGKQGDRLTPVLFNLFFNGLLYYLDSLKIGHRSCINRSITSRGFADDVAVTTTSISDTKKALDAIDNFCEWSGMRLNTMKTKATAYNFLTQSEVDLSSLKYHGEAFEQIPSNSSFKHLGIYTCLQRKWDDEITHIFDGCLKLLKSITKHKYLPGQMVKVVEMIAPAQFRYSAAMVPWNSQQLEKLYLLWLRLHKAALKLANFKSFPNAQLRFPVSQGGKTVVHPKVYLLQAMDSHLRAISLWPDDLRAEASARVSRFFYEIEVANCTEATHILKKNSTGYKNNLFARFLLLANELNIKAVIPRQLMYDIPFSTTWTTLELKWQSEKNDVSLQSVTNCASTTSWALNVTQMKKHGYMVPTQLPKHLQGEKSYLRIPHSIKNPLSHEFICFVENFCIDHDKASHPPFPLSIPADPSSITAPLSRERVSLVLSAPCEGVRVIGNFKITSTKAVSRIEMTADDGSNIFIGAIGQARLNFLLEESELSNQEVLKRMKKWIKEADATPAESTLSFQVLQSLQKVTRAKHLIGGTPITSPSCYPSSWNNTIDKEGWCESNENAGPIMVVLPSLDEKGRKAFCKWVLERQPHRWFMATHEELPVPSPLKRYVRRIAYVNNDKSTPICRNHGGVMLSSPFASRKTKRKWSLWSNVSLTRHAEEEIKERLEACEKAWTLKGVQPLHLNSPFSREAKHSEEGQYYHLAKYVAATDGSLKFGEEMGQAVVWLNEELPTSRKRTEGQPSTSTPELEAIRDALKAAPRTENLVILTDSLSSLQNLTALQRQDFALNVRTDKNRPIFLDIVALVNARAANYAHTTFAKVTAHRGNPLNEWANQEASQAVEATEPGMVILPPYECHYLLPEHIGPKHHIPWSSRVKKLANQEIAHTFLKQRLKQSQGNVKLNATEDFLARTGESREFLGTWLASCKDSIKIRDVMLACSSWQGNQKLHQWRCKQSPQCVLCKARIETDCHIQCLCPNLQSARISAHHGIWVPLFHKVRKCVSKDSSAMLEAPVSSWHTIEAPKLFERTKNKWKRCLQSLSSSVNDTNTDNGVSKHTALEGLWYEISKCPARPQLWKQMILNNKEWSQLIDIEAVLASIFQGAENSPTETWRSKLLAVIHALMGADEAGDRNLLCKRPDGLVVNWKKEEFFVLEFTRAYDKYEHYHAQADLYKEVKYTRLCNFVSERLGPPWKGKVLPLTVGVRGSVNRLQWIRTLSQLGLQKKDIEPIIRDTARAAVEQCQTLYKARAAALKALTKQTVPVQ